MAYFLHQDVQDAALAHIQANCDQIAAVKAYTVGDSYATVMDGSNVTVSAAMTSADFALSNGASNARVLTSASKTATASGSGDPTHIVFVNTATSKILGVTQESSGVSVTAGVSYTIPSIPLEMRQPTAA